MTLKSVLFFLLFSCQIILAQNDVIISIDEVTVSDSQLGEFSNSQSVLKLNDSVIKKSQHSLTTLLNYNSGIYFKENGPGMVSSPSFRGTTAQQTAVIWNGININSQFNGQADFNTIGAGEFNSVSVRSGGGSVIYGSSAIGGSVHLNNELMYGDVFTNELAVKYGSFSTASGLYRVKFSGEKFSLQVGIVHNSSSNDFEFPDGDRKNINGQYYNHGLNSSVVYRIDSKNHLKFYARLFDGERHFALVNPTDTKTKYRDFNSWNLLEWTGIFGGFESRTKIAILSEEYKYYENIEADHNYYGTANTVIGKYDLKFSPSSKIKLNAVIDYTHINGSGSDIENQNRKIGSMAILMKHQIFRRLLYEVSFRKETANDYQSPLLLAAGINFIATKNYSIKINGSRNYRMPTFNDLYWIDASDDELKPESSIQFELGNHIKSKGFHFSVTGYYIKIRDMIQWIPGVTDMWSPQNLNRVNSFGAETMLNMNKQFGNHNFHITGTYNYTVSENALTGYQLIYVPYHKATASAAYQFKNFNMNYQFLFNGPVFTRSDNNARYNIPAYGVSNLGVDYDFGKKPSIKAGFQILNLLDESYKVMIGRPFPGRHFNIYLNFYI